MNLPERSLDFNQKKKRKSQLSNQHPVTKSNLSFSVKAIEIATENELTVEHGIALKLIPKWAISGSLLCSSNYKSTQNFADT